MPGGAAAIRRGYRLNRFAQIIACGASATKLGAVGDGGRPSGLGGNRCRVGADAKRRRVYLGLRRLVLRGWVGEGGVVSLAVVGLIGFWGRRFLLGAVPLRLASSHS